MKKLIAGNWKMNMDGASADALVREIAAHYTPDIAAKADLVVCPPFVYLDRVLNVLRSESVSVGAQDCSDQDNGAFTGQVSARMLENTGCAYVIVGHSERRQYNAETDALIRAKIMQAHKHHLTPILCVGETLGQRESGQEQEIVGAQLSGALPAQVNARDIVIAYEPVWAIGTGKTASCADVAHMHSFIRETLKNHCADFENIHILYGGSMKPGNAGELLSTPNVDGGLIGGASLKAEDFIGIAQAA